MNKQQKVDRIYKTIADKTLSFGCKVLLVDQVYGEMMPFRKPVIITEELDYGYSGYSDYDNGNITFNLVTNKPEIVGHPVMLGNCDKLIEKGPDYLDDRMTIIDLRINKEKPIEEQSDQCIEFVYLLTK